MAAETENSKSLFLYLFRVSCLGVVCGLLISSTSPGENWEIDSLKALHKKSDEGELLAELSFAYKDVSSDSALHYANLCLDRARELQDRLLFSTCKCRKGLAYMKADNLAKGYSYFHESLKIRDSLGEFEAIARSYLDMGNVYYTLGNQQLIRGRERKADSFYKKAETFYLEARRSAMKANSDKLTNWARMNLGALHSQQEEDSLALIYYDTCQQYFKQQNDPIDLADVTCNIARAKMYSGYMTESLQDFQESLNTYESHKKRGKIAECLLNIAEVHYYSDDYTNALKSVGRSKRLAQKLKNRKIELRALEFASQLHAETLQHDSAYWYLKKFDSLQNLVIDEATQKEIAQLSLLYETEKTKRQNATLKAETLEQERDIRTLISILVICLLVLSILVISFLYYRQRQLAKRLDDQRRINELVRDQDQKLINAMLKGQEEERKRVSTELHDRMGSILSTMKLYLTEFKRMTSGAVHSEHDASAETSKSNQSLNKASELIDLAVNELRQISTNLSSGLLVTFGLVPAIREMVEIVNETRQIKVTVKSFGLNERYDSFVEISLYRIVQELLTNTLKHAEATLVEIRFDGRDTELLLTYTDNGKGMDFETSMRKNGLGLQNISERAKALNGQLTFKDASPSGSTFSVIIPVA